MKHQKQAIGEPVVEVIGRLGDVVVPMHIVLGELPLDIARRVEFVDRWKHVLRLTKGMNVLQQPIMQRASFEQPLSDIPRVVE